MLDLWGKWCHEGGFDNLGYPRETITYKAIKLKRMGMMHGHKEGAMPSRDDSGSHAPRPIEDNPIAEQMDRHLGALRLTHPKNFKALVARFVHGYPNPRGASWCKVSVSKYKNMIDESLYFLEAKIYVDIG